MSDEKTPEQTLIGRPKSGDSARVPVVKLAATQETLPLPDSQNPNEKIALDETLGAPPSGVQLAISVEDEPLTPLVMVPSDHYQVKSEIGRGGLGRVVSAFEQRLERDVAVKELLRANPKARERFIREARLTARLQHPGIVPIYEVGSWPTGDPFYSMKMVSGRTLAQLIKEKGNLSERLTLLPAVLDCCEAIAYAHAHNIIHRDIKPQNVLVGDFGETIVIDWGLAKEIEEGVEQGTGNGERGTGNSPEEGAPSTSLRNQERELARRFSSGVEGGRSSPEVQLRAVSSGDAPTMATGETPIPSAEESSGTYSSNEIRRLLAAPNPEHSQQHSRRPATSNQANLTLEGAILGTPSYMPPEQAKAKDVDARSDVYSLGALLYHTLAGDPPYEGTSSFDVVKKVILGPPVPLSQREPGVPPELLAIVQKAMARDVRERYPTAKEMAEDLRRYQAGQLVGVYRYSPIEHLRRFVRKYKTAFQVGGLLSLLLLLFAVVSVLQINRAKTEAQNNFKSALIAKKEAEQSLQVAVAEKARAEESFKTSERAQLSLLTTQGRQALLQGNTSQASLFLVEAYAKAESLQEISDPLRLLVAASMRTTEAQLLSFTPHTEDLTVASFSYDGAQIITAGKDKTVKIWDAKTATLQKTIVTPDVVTSFTLGLGGKTLLASGDNGDATLWDLTTGKTIYTLHHEDIISDFALQPPDAAIIATASWDNTAKLWDAKTGALLRTLSGHTGFVTGVIFNNEGTVVATTSWDKTVKLWDTKTGRLQKTLVGHEDFVWSAQFTNDGAQLLTTSKDKTARLWDVKTGKQLLILTNESGVASASLNNDDTQILTRSWDKTAKLWSTQTGKLEVTFVGHTDTLWGVGFLDAGRVITTSRDRTVKIWGANSGRMLASLEHAQNVSIAKYNANTRRLMTVSANRIFLWDLSVFEPIQTGEAHKESINSLAISPDGALVASAGADGSVYLWRTKEEAKPIAIEPQGLPRTIAFTKDNKTLITINDNGSTKLWDVTTGALRGEMIGDLWSAALSADASLLAVVRRDKTAQILSTASGRVISSLQGFGDIPNQMTFSHDHSTLSIANEDGTVKVWAVASGVRLAAFSAHELGVNTVAYSNDDRRLLTASWDQTVRLFNWQTGKKLSEYKHTTPVIRAAFSLDGKQIVSLTSNKVAFLWDTASGQQITGLEHPGGVNQFVFTSNGEFLATAGQEGTVYLWETKTGTKLHSFVAHFAAVQDLAFAPDDQALITASLDTSLRLWDVSLEQRSAKEMQDRLTSISLPWRLEGGQIIPNR